MKLIRQHFVEQFIIAPILYNKSVVRQYRSKNKETDHNAKSVSLQKPYHAQLQEMALSYRIFLVFSYCWTIANAEVCPKQCDCDTYNGQNRAVCVDQKLVSVDVGVPTQVQVYSLSHNAISELDNYCFKEAGYHLITILNLAFNNIFWIGIHAFSGLESLVSLDLSNNRLRYIPSDLFWDTPKLEFLDLSGNVFETLKNEPFLMHNQLQVLNLNNCRIKALPDRLLTRLPNLRKLDLSDNYVISITIEVLKPLRKLQRLELQSEYWQCTPQFLGVEAWIASRGITYEKQCKKKMPNMMERMVSAVRPEERRDVDIDTVWNITQHNHTTPTKPVKKWTPFEKFDSDFPSFQAFLIGLEVGLALGIVGTYLWLRSLCKCGHLKLNCARAQNRRQHRRIQRRIDGDMRTNLLWSTIINPDLETPPSFRRQLSLPDRPPPFPIYGLPGVTDASAPERFSLTDRSESPPPPYTECRVNL